MLLKKQKVVGQLEENGQRFPDRLKVAFPCDPAVPLLGISPNTKAGSQGDICAPVFPAALSPQTPWEPPPAVQPDEQSNKTGRIHTARYLLLGLKGERNFDTCSARVNLEHTLAVS